IPYLDSIGFCINTAVLLLICIECGVAVLPDNIAAHVAMQHAKAHIKVDEDRLKAIVNACDLCTTWPHIGQGPCAEIAGLTVHQGFPCNHCDASFGTRRNIEFHYYEKHKGISCPSNITTVPVQQLQKGAGSSSSYFKIHQTKESYQLHIENIISGLRHDIRTKQDEAANSIILNDERLLSPWLRTTRWHEYVLNEDVNMLRSLVKAVKTPENQILQASVLHLLQTGVDLIPCTRDLVLQYLNSPDPIKSGINNTPFHRHQNEETLDTYAIEVYHLVHMLLKARQVGYSLPTSDDLDETMEILQEALQEQEQDIVKIAPAILDVLMALWQESWLKNHAKNIPDPTICYIALSQLLPSGAIADVQQVTGVLAKLQYCMQLVFLVKMHDMVEHGEGLSVMETCEVLQHWFVEKKESTFNSIRSLQHRASSLTMTTKSLTRVWWTDTENWDSMLYRGDHIHIQDVRKVFVDMEKTMVQLWEEQILCGLKLYVHHGDLADDLTSNTVGYSFLTDQRNTCFKNRDQLMRAILDNPVTRRQFVQTEWSAPLAENQVMWKIPALCAWLWSYARFEGLVLARIEMLGGSPGRGTELTAMQYCNTRTRSLRNLVVLDKYLSVLRTYHKSAALTGHDKLIPHAIDACTTDLLIQDLALARPFAELAAQICWPGNDYIRELYASALFVNNGELFDSRQLTHIMSTVTNPRVGTELGINDWRHISIAWRRKKCLEVQSLLEDDDYDTIEAQQTGHSRATENRVYGLSPQALAGPGEDVLPLFLRASTRWQETCHVRPGGAWMSYSDASATKYQPSVKPGRQDHSAAFAPSAEWTKDLVKTISDTVTAQVTDNIKNIFKDFLQDKPSAPAKKVAFTGKVHQLIVCDHTLIVWCRVCSQTAQDCENSRQVHI
ncbi:hypothetical protein DENSPDRAFT_902459, partial [Dentipellis sp. KUC8613]